MPKRRSARVQNLVVFVILAGLLALACAILIEPLTRDRDGIPGFNPRNHLVPLPRPAYRTHPVT